MRKCGKCGGHEFFLFGLCVPCYREVEERHPQKTQREKYNEYKANYYERNPHVARAANSNYRGKKRTSTPTWFGQFDRFVLKEATDLCIRREAATGFKWHIDHAVPLKSKVVCGLHIAHNFQVIPAITNIKKGNMKWRDMP